MNNWLKSKWGKWESLSIGKVHEVVYLLQARKHKNGKVQFRVEQSKSLWGAECPKIEQINQLKKGGEDEA